MEQSRDGRDELRARLSQMDKEVIAANHHFMRGLGPGGLVRVFEPITAPEKKIFVKGYITTYRSLSGMTPAEMRKLLGLRINDLLTGAAIYQLDYVPMIGTFLPRGYTTLPDGRPLRPGVKVDEAGYRAGQGAWQAVLIEAQPATLLAVLAKDERWQPGMHPKYRV